MTAPTERSVPSVRELRPVAQGAKTDRRLTYRLFRSLSIWITWVLLHTRVTPNQVTVASLLIAAAGLVLTGFGGLGPSLAGLALLLVYHLVDRVDGELARVRQHFSLVGIYLDNAGHYVSGAGIFIALSSHMAPAVEDDRWVWLLGAAGAVAAAMARIEKHAAFQLYSQYVLEEPTLLDALPARDGRLTRADAKADRAVEDAPRDLVGLVRDVLLTSTAFPQTVVAGASVVVLLATLGTTAAVVAFAIIVALHGAAWLGVEYANLSQNLAHELRRLRDVAAG